jgi:hypothetical protein
LTYLRTLKLHIKFRVIKGRANSASDQLAAKNLACWVNKVGFATFLPYARYTKAQHKTVTEIKPT